MTDKRRLAAAIRTRLVTFQIRSVGDDDYGGEVEEWNDVFQEYAAVYFGGGSEQREVAQRGGSQVANFEVLSNNNTRLVNLTDFRIAFDQRLWDITAKHDLGLNDGILITAVSVAT